MKPITTCRSACPNVLTMAGTLLCQLHSDHEGPHEALVMTERPGRTLRGEFHNIAWESTK